MTSTLPSKQDIEKFRRVYAGEIYNKDYCTDQFYRKRYAYTYEELEYKKEVNHND